MLVPAGLMLDSFIPSSADQAAVSQLAHNANGWVMKMPSTDGGPEHSFNALSIPNKDVDCILLWDAEAQCFRLERLSATLDFNLIRSLENRAGVAKKTGMEKKPIQTSPKLANAAPQKITLKLKKKKPDDQTNQSPPSSLDNSPPTDLATPIPIDDVLSGGFDDEGMDDLDDIINQELGSEIATPATFSEGPKSLFAGDYDDDGYTSG
ncbi:hypothetical protein HDU91_007343 [Kappamyces sp. JEL0680]|nr:hypothetical protein HDU91_007343 [Kappamyces sp. JEL0680]